MSGPHPLMAPGETAALLGVSWQTVWRRRQAGDLGCIRLPGGTRRYFRAEIEALQRGEPLTAAQVAGLRRELLNRVAGGPDGPALLTPAEAADALAVHPRALARWDGLIESVRGPRGARRGARRYLRAEIEGILLGTPLTAAEAAGVREAAIEAGHWARRQQGG